MPDSRPLSELVRASREGDQPAAEELLNAAYDELRRLAAHFLRMERRNHTLQPTELVHELYMKVFASDVPEWNDRNHFFAVAARQLRHILVNHARDRRARKRGGGAIRLSLDEVNGMEDPIDEDLLSVHEALCELERLDSRAGKVVELRFFGGLQEKEAAAVLGISVATLKRDWEFARAWLLTRLNTPGRSNR